MKGMMQMQANELLELYQLLRMYRCTDPENKTAAKMMSEVSALYAEYTKGKDIDAAGNPRGAGRKRFYTEKQDENILMLYKRTRSYRKTAVEAGCSVGHVQDVIRRLDAD